MSSGLVDLWPLQFLRIGYYNRSYGYLNDLTTYGHWWSNTASLATNGRRLYTRTGNVNAQRSDFRGNGLALRGVAPTALFQRERVKIKLPTPVIKDFLTR